MFNAIQKKASLRSPSHIFNNLAVSWEPITFKISEGSSQIEVHCKRSTTKSSGDTLKLLCFLIRDYYLNIYKDDNIKNLNIRKLFDTIITSLECLMVNGVDVSSDELNALLLGFLNKNFL